MAIGITLYRVDGQEHRDRLACYDQDDARNQSRLWLEEAADNTLRAYNAQGGWQITLVNGELVFKRILTKVH